MKAEIEEEVTRARLLSTGPGVTSAISDPRPVVTSPARKRRRVLLWTSGVVLMVGAVVFGAVRAQEKTVTPSAVQDVMLDGNSIRFTEDFARRHHVGTVEAGESELSSMVQAMGTVRYDVRRFAAVGARSAGRVRRVYKIMGDPVRPGDVLADIESVVLGQAQATAETLRAKEIASAANLAREEQLASARITAAREAELARAEHQSLRAQLRAAEKAVAAFGAGRASEVGILKLRSPIAGRVIVAQVSQGQTVEPSDTLFKVADLSKVWAELAVFERDLRRVHEGDTVEIVPGASGARPLQGALAHVSDLVDPATRTAIARVEVDNRAGELHPGESVTGRIHSRAPAARAVTIPKVAITFVDGKPTALVNVAPGLVEPRPLELGGEDGERVAIRSGLHAGERVVTDGLFALKAEIFR